MKKFFYPLLALLFLSSFTHRAAAETAAIFFPADTTVYQTFAICEGDAIVVGNSIYTEAGVYRDTLLSSQMDDSILVTNIVLWSAESLLPQSIKVCSEQGFSLDLMPSLLQRAYSTLVNTPLPDGVGLSSDIPFFVNSFPPGQLMESVDDLGSICLNIEHSWLHDLEIKLICPSGQSVVLQNQAFIADEVFLGEPNELMDTAALFPPGVGWDYCWVSGASQTLTEYSIAHPAVHNIPAGEYRPYEDFSNLLGCPLNGQWMITSLDKWGSDNGWAFNGSLGFQVPTDVPVTYLWSTGETTPSVTISETGFYSVTVTTPSDCVLTDTIEVVLQPAQIVNIQSSQAFLALSAGASAYQWLQGWQQEPIPGAIQQAFDYNGHSGPYQVAVSMYGTTCISPPLQIRNFQSQQAGSDCAEAIFLCGNTTVYSPLAIENLNDDFDNPNNGPGCLTTGEENARWYKFSFSPNMPAGKVLSLNITSGEDLNFAIYGPNAACDSLGEPIRCSYAAQPFCFDCATGLANTASDTSEDETGDGFLAPLPVQAGQTYYLLLNVPIDTEEYGFNIEVAGSAAPYMDCNGNFCPMWLNAGEDRAICDQQSFQLDDVTLNAPPNSTYQWIGQYGTEAFIDNASMLNPMVHLPYWFTEGELNYTLVVSSTNQCAIADAVKILVGSTPTTTISGARAFCEGSSTTLQVSGQGLQHLWSTGSTGTSIIVSEPGVYSVTSRNNNGCETNAAVEVIALAPEITLVPGTNQLTPTTSLPGSYQWYLNGFPIAGATSVSYTCMTSGSYQLQQTYQGASCLSNAISVTVTSANEARADAFTVIALPNPSDGKIRLESSVPVERILVLNAYGQQLRTLQSEGQSLLSLDLSEQPSGVYGLVVHTTRGVHTLKIVITK